MATRKRQNRREREASLERKFRRDAATESERAELVGFIGLVLACGRYQRAQRVLYGLLAYMLFAFMLFSFDTQRDLMAESCAATGVNFACDYFRGLLSIGLIVLSAAALLGFWLSRMWQSLGGVVEKTTAFRRNVVILTTFSFLILGCTTALLGYALWRTWHLGVTPVELLSEAVLTPFVSPLFLGMLVIVTVCNFWRGLSVFRLRAQYAEWQRKFAKKHSFDEVVAVFLDD